jgi:hypothetical protein
MHLRLFSLVVVLLVAGAGCSKAVPPGGDPDGPPGDDTPDAANTTDAPSRFDALPDGPPAIDAAPDASIAPVDVTLAQATVNTAASILAGNSIGCNNTADNTTRENSYYRAFTLSEHGVTGPLTIASVRFGIEDAQGFPGTNQPATIRIHTYTGAVGTTLNLAQLTMVAEANFNIMDSATALRNVPIAATIPSGTFVVELLIPDGDPGGLGALGPLFFLGSNASGETKPGYLRAPECGITAPTVPGSISPGFPGMHMIMTVAGSYQP